MNAISRKMLITLFLIVSSLYPTRGISDTIDTSQVLRDNGETVISSGGAFKLGFFSPGNSKNHYLGIWYNNIAVRTVVWVANREAPITEPASGMLRVTGTGRLVLVNDSNATVWSTNTSRAVQNPVAQLLDSGNLVVRDSGDGINAGVYLWQSFDYPSDTLLPGMKLGWDLRTRLDRRMLSWKSPDDPSPGELSFGILLDAYPHAVLWKGEQKYYRAGPNNGVRFSGVLKSSDPVFEFTFVSNQDEVYYSYQLVNKSMIARVILNESTSKRERYVWVETDMSWKLYAAMPGDYCDTYGLCGPNGVCVISDLPVCRCLQGFKPKLAQRWDSMDWSQGCVLEEPLDCARKHGFVRFSNLKLPDTENSWVINRSINLRECREACLKNCSCMAYANLDISGRVNGCILWVGDLVDIRRLSDGDQDLYIRIPFSNEGSEGRKREILIVTLSLVIGVILISLSLLLYSWRVKKLGHQHRETVMPRLDYMENHPDESHNKILELPLFDLPTLTKATDNFSINNKLGEGGYGPVYKGVLEEGQDIAVKRLSRTSYQGLDEFRNEISCTAKLQHRNLVKLLGCCIHGEEKLLVYEYLTNKSLDLILFDASKRKLLEWPRRFNIINGIARGLLYLHQDSRLRVIHRDLKASNVLLDSDMNPKISDFGLARAFGGNQTEANTSRVVGTYGYMSPEYAVEGLFSVKSDVFSFGVLVLEIVSSRRNRGFSNRDHSLNLLGHAWMLYKEERSLELVDSDLRDSCCHLSQVMRSICIGLLCVQEFPEDRPNMSSVVQMLSNESALPQAKHPGFFTGRKTVLSTETSVSSSNTTSSANEMTITLLDAR